MVESNLLADLEVSGPVSLNGLTGEYLEAARRLEAEGRIEKCGVSKSGRMLYRRAERDPWSLDVPPPTLPHACCGDARVLACVCAYAYDCPTHGATHIGTHD